MRRIVLLCFVALMVMSCADNKAAKDEPEEKEKKSQKASDKGNKDQDEEQWSGEQKQVFMDDCRNGEMNRSVTSKEDCSCIYKKLSARVSYQDYRVIFSKVKEDEMSEDEGAERLEKLDKTLTKIKREIKDDCGISLGKE